MKKIILISTLLLVAFSCTKVTITASPKPAPKATPSGKVPPGQAKKASGDQSAKKYAPGQQKKTESSKKGNGNSQGQNGKGKSKN
jgi:hypothetical protein